MKRFINRHRYTCILLLFFILIVILGIKVKDVLVPDEEKATYGERLKDISKHSISDEIYQKIDSGLKSEKVKKITHRIQGKILNYYFTFDDKVSTKDAKAIGEKLLSYFDEDLLNYYSIQIYLLKEDDSLNNFPIIGFKDPLAKNISWTKEREIVVKENKSGGNEE